MEGKPTGRKESEKELIFSAISIKIVIVFFTTPFLAVFMEEMKKTPVNLKSMEEHA